MDYKISRNELGYMEILPKPSASELADFYNKNYFDQGNYYDDITDAERFHKYVPFKEAHALLGKESGYILDVGCGEGFSLDYFNSKGFEVSGIDFTSDGINRFFPKLEKNLTTGNIFEILESWITVGDKKFDMIMCNNVLEHVINPIEMLNNIKKMLNPGGICRFQVPNDYSILQNYAVNKKIAKKDFWLAPPAHLQYFDKSSLIKTLEHCGYKVNMLLGDFPIDLFLLNKDTNYVENKSVGKNCHYARVEFDNLLGGENIDDLIAFRKGCAASGIGRNLIAYCEPIK